ISRVRVSKLLFAPSLKGISVNAMRTPVLALSHGAKWILQRSGFFAKVRKAWRSRLATTAGEVSPHKMSLRWKRMLLLLVVLGFGVRLALVFDGGNLILAPWSAGGDTPAYVALADNVLQGKGLTYAGVPTAFRPPIYPFVLAGSHLLVGSRYILFVRMIQVFSAVLAAWLCAKVSSRVWGSEGAWITLACFAASPALIYLNSEILTESFAVLLTCYF